MKKLILHVGMPKTGTSAIQTALFNNRNKLIESGILYPEFLLKQNPPKHQKLVRAFNQAEFKELKSFLKANKFPTVIMSTEGITNHLYDFPSESFKLLKEVTRGYELVMVYSTRERESWLRSYYTQAVLNPQSTRTKYYGTSLTYEQFINLDRIHELSDYVQLKKDLNSKLNPKQIIHINYTKNILPIFLDALQFPHIENGKPKDINFSPPSWTIEFMRQINQLTGCEFERSQWKKIIKNMTGTNHAMITKLGNQELLNLVAVKEQLNKVHPFNNDKFSINDNNLKKVDLFLNC